MSIETLSVPDLGGASDVEVIEVCVAVGDELELEQSIVVLETDKATMEVPCTKAGKVTAVHISEGGKLNEGDALVDIEVVASESAPVEEKAAAPAVEEVVVADKAAEKVAEPAVETAATETEIDIIVPDLGGAEDVDVIEVCVAAGDEVAEGDSIIVLETDKASMEIPAEHAGTIVSLDVSEGGKINKGQSIGRIKAVVAAAPVAAASQATDPKAEPATAAPAPAAESSGEAKLAPPPATVATIEPGPETAFYAGPAVRQLARQLGVELSEIKASGPRGRLSKEDVRNHAKTIIEDVKSGKLSSGAGIPEIPHVDHSQFGPISIEPLSKIAKITAQNMSRNWLNVPHVTQFDDADITELEAFRKSMKAEAEKRGSKLTPLPFLIKAVAATLRAEPSFNVSLHSDGENIVRKDYVHIGIAADTPRGLLVPVLRDVDKKGLWQIADEVNELIGKARDGKLMPKDMQGACFTISSLGAMGGKGFTPIVNAPEVAIMGVSKASIQPVWDGKEFQPRQMLPLSLSYDHRAINGADCGRFFTNLVATLSDIRRLLL
ncbi:dihydrolipoyllysine-residue acetyltransferase [uncultured Pseudoteredinibacter sp.]|uniref:dihydrolipoyllysine-residue acetyltransferase n=1 Tax=uncultured Pseudoteredinibacter sp. TaxID=1641701 RepID=UPI002630997B|nr:dihydrolipoyllysine-residue acetyltransferase [uncultured Pseudoteredinibacter sp.]